MKSNRGDAVLFYALHPNGTTDLTSEHGSCPTLKVLGLACNRDMLSVASSAER